MVDKQSADAMVDLLMQAWEEHPIPGWKVERTDVDEVTFTVIYDARSSADVGSNGHVQEN